MANGPSDSLSWSSYALLQAAVFLLSNIEVNKGLYAAKTVVNEAQNLLLAIQQAIDSAPDLSGAVDFYGEAAVKKLRERIAAEVAELAKKIKPA